MPGVFSMLKVIQLPPKPRKQSMIIMSELGIPLRATEDLLEVASSIIDYAKITDHAGLADRLTAEWIVKKIALYKKYGIDVLPGGIPLQVAVLQGQAEAYLEAVAGAGFCGVEISEDVMPPLAADKRKALIARALGMGLAVMTEMGRKNLDTPFNTDEIIEQILRDIDLGVSKIYLESSEIQDLYERDPGGLDRIAGLGKNEYLLFELGLVEAQEKADWLVRRYGPAINFASVSPADVVPVDAIRRGMHRKAGFSYMTGDTGAKVTAHI